MSNTAPYINDQKSSFKMEFLLFDRSLSTSEVDPLHLTIPKNKNVNKRATPTKSDANSPTRTRDVQPKQAIPKKVEPQTKKAEPAADKPEKQMPQKALLSQTLKSYMSTNIAKNQRASMQRSPAQKQPQDDQMARTTPHVTPSEETKPAVPNPVENKLPGKATTLGLDFALNGTYLLPCLSSQSISMQVKIEKTPKDFYIYRLQMPAAVDPEQRLRVELYGHYRDSEAHVIFNGKEVGEMHYNSGNKSFSVALTAFQPYLECCSIIFNPSFSTPAMPRIFDFIFPALKKVDGRNQMFKIPFADNSQLVQCVSRMGKEAIRLKTKIPVNNGNTFDTLFDGKFTRPSPLNFVLYHDSNPKKFICSFSAVDDTTYNLVVGYPLSPIQAFFAAVAASIPF